MTKSRLIVRLLAALFSLVFPSLAFADGELDSSFDTDGKVITEFPSCTGFGVEHVNEVAMAPGSKIVVASWCNQTMDDWVDSTARDLLIVQYNADGSLDAGFGSGGILIHDFDATPTDDYRSDDFLNDLAVQPDGKIVAVGHSYQGRHFQTTPPPAPSSDRYFLARFTESGSLDPSFGSGGIVTGTTGSWDSNLDVVSLQNDGKIVSVGHLLSYGSPTQTAVFRFTSAGAPDVSFTSTGSMVVALPPDVASFSAYDLAVQSDGKILFVGTAQLGPESYATLLIRVLPNGSMDSTFGSGGIARTSLAGFGRQMAIQPDGKIIVGSSSGIEPARVLRFNPDGSLDTGFGLGGVAQGFGFSGGDYALEDVALAADGKVVVGGYFNAGAGTPQRFGLARLNDDGSLDTTFGTGGAVMTPVQDMAAIYGLVIQPDQKIVAAGVTALTGGAQDYALARYRVGLGTSAAGAAGLSFPFDAVVSGAVLKNPHLKSDGKKGTPIFKWGRLTESLNPSIDKLVGARVPSLRIATCGNGKLEKGEECDDGNVLGNDACSPTCKNTFCGDGVVQEALGEFCDDGNQNPSDSCTNECKITLEPVQKVPLKQVWFKMRR